MTQVVVVGMRIDMGAKEYGSVSRIITEFSDMA